MNRIILTLAALLVASPAFAQRIITKGATDQTVYIRIIDSGDGTPETGVTSATSGIDLEYVRNRATVTNLTESDLGAADSTHSDGGIIHVGGGLYRVDLPDAAVATGVPSVVVGGTITGMIVIPLTIQLTDADFQTALADSTEIANEVRDTTLTAPTAPPGITPTIGEALAWLSWWTQAKTTTPAGSGNRSIYADDGTTVISEEPLSDNGTTFTKGEAAAP